MNTTSLIFPSNKFADVEKTFLVELHGLYADGEIRAFVTLLCEAYLGWDKVAYLLRRKETINQSDLLRFHWALCDLKRFRPIQHITGYSYFCGCRIAVNGDVLIPRPETEEMVGNIVAGGWRPKSCSRIIDLCTGSGCIAIALKSGLPKCSVTGVDISPAALKTARANAETNGVEVNFVEGDVLSEEFRFEDGFDLIVSNPPYVAESERETMPHNVLDYEPGLALFVPDNEPLQFYKAIAVFAERHLNAGGRLALEVNERFAAETVKLLADHGLEATAHRDFRRKERFVTAAPSSR